MAQTLKQSCDELPDWLLDFTHFGCEIDSFLSYNWLERVSLNYPITIQKIWSHMKLWKKKKEKGKKKRIKNTDTSMRPNINKQKRAIGNEIDRKNDCLPR